MDLSLIEMTLRLSPTERVANMERQLRFVQQLQQAAREQQRTLHDAAAVAKEREP